LVYILGLGFVTSQAAPQRPSSEFKRGFSLPEFLRMVRWLRANRPRTIVLLHNPWWVSCAAWFAGVPERWPRVSMACVFIFKPIDSAEAQRGVTGTNPISISI